MPNNDTPSKRKPIIDDLAKKAIADLDQVIKANSNLELDLQPVKDSLIKIASDPHRPK